MGYHNDLGAAAAWLNSIQRPDRGWGLAPGQASSIVNTAEALFVLRRAGSYPAKVAEAVEFIQENVFLHVERLGPRIRYVAFALLGLCDDYDHRTADPYIIRQCCEWLVDAKNSDNGWGQEAGSGDSELFPTCLALWGLKAANWPQNLLEPSFQWIIAQARNVGWSLQKNQGPSPVATAYALLALGSTRYAGHDRAVAGKDFLLQTRHWGMEEEVIAGTVWKHCTYGSVIPALIQSGENPYAPVIAEGLRYVNTLRSRRGGWNETENDKGRTVRAQYWSVLALDSVYRNFDPAIHVLRIDAERAQEVLTEPEFVKIAIQSRWATIIPADFYKATVYLLLAAAPLCLFGMYRELDGVPKSVDALLCLALLAGAWLLIRKRRRYFPRVAGIFKFLVGTLAVVSLLLGTNARDALLAIRDIVLDVVAGVGS